MGLIKRLSALLAVLFMVACASAESPSDFLVNEDLPKVGTPLYPEAAKTVFDFPGVFLPEGCAPEWSANSYVSPNLSIAVSSRRVNSSDVYIADVYIRSLDCFRRDAGNGFRNGYLSVKQHAVRDGAAVLAITGDSSAKFIAGFVVGNGEVWRSEPNRKRDIAVLDWDGMLRTYTPEEMAAMGWEDAPPDCWQLFLFGPGLLDSNGHAKTSFTTTNVIAENPRAAIGCYEPGHYCLILADGRQTWSALEEKKHNRGLTMEELSCLMEELGCISAYNLDGGKSAVMVFHGEFVNTPINHGRQINDAIILGEPKLLP